MLFMANDTVYSGNCLRFFRRKCLHLKDKTGKKEALRSSGKALSTTSFSMWTPAFRVGYTASIFRVEETLGSRLF